MFLLLVLIALLHQVYYTVNTKVEMFPAKMIFLRVIEMLGRISIIPIVLFYYLHQMKQQPDATTTTFTIIGIAFPIIVFCREITGIYSTFRHSLRKIILKASDPNTTIEKMSYIELFLINWNVFHVISFDVIRISQRLHDGHELVWKSKYGTKLNDAKQIIRKKQMDIELPKIYKVMNTDGLHDDSDDEIEMHSFEEVISNESKNGLKGE